MKRTTVYIPDEMKAGIEREAARRDVTEAEVIRSAVSASLGTGRTKRSVFPVFAEGLGEDLAGRVDDLLPGMGAREHWR